MGPSKAAKSERVVEYAATHGVPPAARMSHGLLREEMPPGGGGDKSGGGGAVKGGGGGEAVGGGGGDGTGVGGGNGAGGFGGDDNGRGDGNGGGGGFCDKPALFFITRKYTNPPTSAATAMSDTTTHAHIRFAFFLLRFFAIVTWTE